MKYTTLENNHLYGSTEQAAINAVDLSSVTTPLTLYCIVLLFPAGFLLGDRPHPSGGEQ